MECNKFCSFEPRLNQDVEDPAGYPHKNQACHGCTIDATVCVWFLGQIDVNKWRTCTVAASVFMQSFTFWQSAGATQAGPVSNTDPSTVQ